MKKLLVVATALLIVAAFTVDAASARHHHRIHQRTGHAMTTGSAIGPAGSNAELKGNNGNSAGGSNSLANPNNAGNSH